jgi:hypothetical protein
VSPVVLVWYGGNDSQDGLTTGCRSHREDIEDRTDSIDR